MINMCFMGEPEESLHDGPGVGGEEFDGEDTGGDIEEDVEPGEES